MLRSYEVIFFKANLTSFANLLLFFLSLQNGRSHSRSASSLRCWHIAVHTSHVCHQRRSGAESPQSVLMWSPAPPPTMQSGLRWLSCSKPAERSCQDLSGSVAPSLPMVKKCNFCSSRCVWHICVYSEAAGLSQEKKGKKFPLTPFSSCFWCTNTPKVCKWMINLEKWWKMTSSLVSFCLNLKEMRTYSHFKSFNQGIVLIGGAIDFIGDY